MATHQEFMGALVAQLPALRRYAVALVGSATKADDLVQDTIERAIRRSSQLKELERLSGWLRRILHNLYVDEIRRGRGRGTEQDITELADDLSLSVAAYDGAEIRELLRAMGSLSIEHRQILLLVGLEEMNYREIAEELDIPIGTVMSRLARARENLRGALRKVQDAVEFKNVS